MKMADNVIKSESRPPVTLFTHCRPCSLMFSFAFNSFVSSEVRMMQTRSLGARRGSAVVSLPGDHYKMDLHVLDKEQMGKKWIAYTVYA